MQLKLKLTHLGLNRTDNFICYAAVEPISEGSVPGGLVQGCKMTSDLIFGDFLAVVTQQRHK